MNSFDRISPVYDILARLVFGDAIELSTIHFLETIGTKASVLVLGGGSGSLLRSLDCQQITYLEKSGKMLELARRKALDNIEFVHHDFLEWENRETYDVVICPFFLDVFKPEQLMQAINKIQSVLKDSGILLVADFEDSDKRPHRILLTIMHIFFRWMAQLESKRLQPIKQLLIKSGLQIEKEAHFYDGLIFSCKLKRTIRN